MADSAVAVTSGAGTNIDTRTEATNGNHRQVVVIGDPSNNAGVAPVDVTNGLSVNVTNASLTVASHAVTNTALTNFGAGSYETVAASATAQALGATGATGDYIAGVLVIPATTTPGVVTLLDNATSIPLFVGGA